MAEETSKEWERYGKALIGSMTEVLAAAKEEHHPVILETADYWLSLGLSLAINHRDAADQLLKLIEAEEPARKELEADATSFIEEVLQ